MDAVTEGQDVVVTDRRHFLSYEEGVVTRAKPDADGRVRVHFPTVKGEAQNPDDWRAVELSVLGAVPHAGERYEWHDRNNSSRTPFTVGERFPYGHPRWAGLFPILADDATPWELRQGHSGIVSAAEVAKFATRLPDDDGTTSATPAEVSKPLLVALRDDLVKSALEFEAAAPGDSSYWAARAAVRRDARAYRTARDA